MKKILATLTVFALVCALAVGAAANNGNNGNGNTGNGQNKNNSFVDDTVQEKDGDLGNNAFAERQDVEFKVVAPTVVYVGEPAYVMFTITNTSGRAIPSITFRKAGVDAVNSKYSGEVLGESAGKPYYEVSLSDGQSFDFVVYLDTSKVGEFTVQELLLFDIEVWTRFGNKNWQDKLYATLGRNLGNIVVTERTPDKCWQAEKNGQVHDYAPGDNIWYKKRINAAGQPGLQGVNQFMPGEGCYVGNGGSVWVALTKLATGEVDTLSFDYGNNQGQNGTVVGTMTFYLEEGMLKLALELIDETRTIDKAGGSYAYMLTDCDHCVFGVPGTTFNGFGPNVSQHFGEVADKTMDNGIPGLYIWNYAADYVKDYFGLWNWNAEVECECDDEEGCDCEE
jgi:hypothetical protein